MLLNNGTVSMFIKIEYSQQINVFVASTKLAWQQSLDSFVAVTEVHSSVQYWKRFTFTPTMI